MRADMWRIFEEFRMAVDVFIPQKRAKDGKKFGFVRFKGVSNAVELEALLQEIMVQRSRLFSNQATFKRSEEDVTVAKKKAFGSKEYHISPAWNTLQPLAFIRGKSFVGALKEPEVLDSSEPVLHMKVLTVDEI